MLCSWLWSLLSSRGLTCVLLVAIGVSAMHAMMVQRSERNPIKVSVEPKNNGIERSSDESCPIWQRQPWSGAVSSVTWRQNVVRHMLAPWNAGVDLDFERGIRVR